MSPRPKPQPSTLEPLKAPRREHPMAIMGTEATPPSTPEVTAAPTPKPAANASKEVKTARLTVDIPVDLHRRTKALASIRGEKLNAVVADALSAHLDAAPESL